LEKRGIVNISRRFFPLVLFSFIDRKSIPSIGTFGNSAVNLVELTRVY
jgi:hypothetical protein